MKLLIEINEQTNVISESVEGGKKNYFIEGIFLQGGIKNRNGRMYRPELLEREVGRYNDNYITKNRAYGELGHPSGPTINLERVSHMITSLKRDGDNYVGRAKITTETPYGGIAKALIDEGATLGISSRGMGSLKLVNGINEVQDDFYMATAGDLVSDPSAPNAYMNAVIEGAEWVFDEKFGWRMMEQLEDQQNFLKNNFKKIDENTRIQMFQKFMDSITVSRA